MKKLIVLLLAVLLNITAFAQQKDPHVNEPDSYNYLAAKQAFERGNYEAFQDYTRKELLLNPNNGYVLLLGSSMALFQQDFQQAVAYSKAALANAPKDDKELRGRAICIQAVLDYFQGNHDSFVEKLQQGAKLSPAAAVHGLSMLVQMEEYDEATKVAQSILKSDPNNEMVLGILGSVYITQEQYKDALADAQKILKINPKSDVAFNIRSRAYYELNQYGKAVDDAIAAYRISKDAQDWELLKLYAMDEDTTPYMEQKFAPLREKDPMWGSWNALQAEVLEETGELFIASHHYLEALRYDSGNPAHAYDLSRAYFNMGMYQQALKAATLARRMNGLGEDVDTYKKYAEQEKLCNVYSGNVEAFIDSLSYQLEQNIVDTISAVYERAWAYELIGRWDEAIHDYQLLCEKHTRQLDESIAKRDSVETVGKTEDDETDYESNVRAYHSAVSDCYYAMGLASAKKGDVTVAREYLMKSLKAAGIESIAADSVEKHAPIYAWIGEKEKAIELLNMEEADPENSWPYGRLQVYSALKDREKAIEALREHINNDNDFFDLNKIDTDYSYVRQFPEFREIMDEAKKKWLEEKAEYIREADEYFSSISQ